MTRALGALALGRALAATAAPRDHDRHHGADRVFLAEHRLSGARPERAADVTRRLATATADLRRAGTDVRVLGSAYVPGDESLLVVLAAPSEADASRAVRAADMTAQRLVPALWRGA